MYENLSEKVPHNNIVVQRKKNQIVTTQDFVFEDMEFGSKFDRDDHMLKEI